RIHATVLREPALNAAREVQLDAQPPDESEGRAELREDTEVTPELVLNAVGVAHAEVEVGQVGIALTLAIEHQLQRRVELECQLGIDKVLDAGRKMEILGGREVRLRAESQVSNEVERLQDAECDLELEKRGHARKADSLAALATGLAVLVRRNEANPSA